MFMVVLPTLTIIFFVAFKMPKKMKRMFFKVPTWISATVLALLIGHSMSGVMAVPAALLCDMVLWPAFNALKKMHDYSEWKATQPKKELPVLRLFKSSSKKTAVAAA